QPQPGRAVTDSPRITCAATPAAHQISCCAGFEQWISRGIDAIDARNGIEDDVTLLSVVVRDDLIYLNCAKADFSPILWPVRRRVVCNIFARRYLNHNAHLHWTLRKTFLDFAEKNIRRCPCHG